MRISSQQIFDAGIQALQKQTGDVVEYQRQISSGQRFSKASESPLAAGLGVQVSMKRAVFTMYKINQDQLDASLTSTDTQLKSLYDMLARFQQMTVQATNAALGPDGRKQLGFQAETLIKSMETFSNAKDANGQPVLKQSGADLEVQVAPSISLRSALTYQEVMGRTVSSAPALTDTDGTPVNVVNGQVDVLTVLGKLKDSIDAGHPFDPDDLAGLQLALTQVSKAQTKVGALQNELEAAVESAEVQQMNAENNRVSVLDTDLGAATAGLARASALLQAVQSVISSLDTNSLFKKL